MDEAYMNTGPANKRGDISWRHGGSESGDGTTPTTFKNGDMIRGASNNAYQSSYNQNSHSQESYKQGPNTKDGHDALLDEQSLRNGDRQHDSESRKEKRNQDSQRETSNPIDDMPIKAKAPKTFEQLLEEEMAKGTGGGGIVQAQPQQQSPSKAKQTDSALPKRDFLRKNTNLRQIPSGRVKSNDPSRKKHYRYYADNFNPKADRLSEKGASGKDSNHDNASAVDAFNTGGPVQHSATKPTFNQWLEQEQ